MCVTDVPAATATCYLLGSAVTRVGLLAMAASIQFDPLEVPRYLTEIHALLICAAVDAGVPARRSGRAASAAATAAADAARERERAPMPTD